MEIKKGIAVSPGISIAKALIIDSEDYRIPRRSIKASQLTAEIQRVRNAFKDAISELTELEATHAKTKGSKIKDIFAVHLRFLHDRSLRKKITDLVRSELVTAEYAVSTALREIAAHFSKKKMLILVNERRICTILKGVCSYSFLARSARMSSILPKRLPLLLGN